MQNGTNFAVICNPKTPMELLKIHRHFREESILTFRHSPLSLQRELPLPTQFFCWGTTSPLLQSEPSAVLPQPWDARPLGLSFRCLRSGHTCRSITSSQQEQRAMLLGLVVSLLKPPLRFHLRIGTSGKSPSCLLFLAGRCGCYCYTHSFLLFFF